MISGRAVRGDEQGIAEASRAQVLEEGAHRLDVLFRTRHQRQQNLAPIGADAPRREHRFAPLARMQPLGDAVDEQIDDRVLGKIALGKGFVLRPQPFGDLAHRRPRQKSLAGLVAEGVLDVARRQPARVKFDRQPFQFLRAPRKRRPHARHERLGRLAHLRRRILHRALRRFHLARSIAVAVARPRAVAARIALAPQRVGDLAFQRLLDDQAQRETDQIAPPGRRPQLSVHQSAKLLARTFGCG